MKTTTKSRTTHFTDDVIASTAAAVGITPEDVRSALKGYRCSNKDDRYNLACAIQALVDPAMEAYCDVCEAASEALDNNPRDIEGAFRAARAAVAGKRISILEIEYGARDPNPDDIYGRAW